MNSPTETPNLKQIIKGAFSAVKQQEKQELIGKLDIFCVGVRKKM